MRHQVRWGILGAAWISGKAVLPAIQASANGRAVVIGGRDRVRCERMAAEFGVDRVVDGYQAVIEADEVDAVYIPLTNDQHLPWVLRALAAGKHVLCEKPLGMNAAEVERMMVAAEDSGRLLMEAFMYRFHPRLRTLMAGLQEPRHLHATFAFPLDKPGNYRLDPRLGGGALMDVGCYTLSVARWALGEPVAVSAAARVGETGVDMSVSGWLKFDSGATASFFASFESPEHQVLDLITSRDSIRIEAPFTSYVPPDDPYRLMVEEFAAAVLADRPAPLPPADSLANQRLIDRVRRSAGLPLAS